MIGVLVATVVILEVTTDPETTLTIGEGVEIVERIPTQLHH